MPGPAQVWCDSDECKTFRPARRLDWNELADAQIGESGDARWDEHVLTDYWDEERQGPRADPRALAMGPHELRMPGDLPALPFYRPVRQCSVCGSLIWTAEVNAQGELGLFSYMRLLTFFTALGESRSKARTEIAESLEREDAATRDALASLSLLEQAIARHILGLPRP